MAMQPVNSSRLKQLPLFLVLTLIYFGAGQLNLRLSLELPYVTPVWVPAGIALAALIVYGYRVWPAIFVASLLGHLSISGSSLLLPAGATLEALAGAYLINRFVHGANAFDTAKDAFRFVFLACICTPAISPALGVGRMYLIGQMNLKDAVLVFLTWWLAHGVGILLVAPFLILLLRSPRQSWDLLDLAELAVLLIGLIFVCLLVFGPLSLSLNSQKFAAAWLCTPFVIWAGFRFRPLEATGTTLILFGSAIWGTVQGYGSFVGKSLTTSLVRLDTFIGVTGTMTLVVAAMVEEQRRIDAKLLQAQTLLKQGLENSDQKIVVTVQALETEVSGHVQTKKALQAIRERLRRIAPDPKLENEN